MQCKKITQHLDDYVDHYLDETLNTQINAHVSGCSSCQEKLHDIHNTRSLVKMVTEPPPSYQLAERILDRVQQEKSTLESISPLIPQVSPKDRKRWQPWAIAAQFVIVAVLIVFMFDMPSQRNDVVKISANIDTSNKLNFVFHSALDRNNVTFSLAMPNGLDLQGYSGQKVIAWSGRLKRGANLLSLPVVQHEPKQGIIELLIYHGNDKRVFQITVEPSHKTSPIGAIPKRTHTV